MAGKRGKNAAADEEIDELFEGLGHEAATPKKMPKPKAGKTKTGAAAEPAKDILAELESELGDNTSSRPHTPRLKDHKDHKDHKDVKDVKGTAARRAAATPPPDGALPRRSAESAKSAEAETAAAAAASPAPSPAAGGGWWGGILSTASAAMKQAEAAVKEIQQNEEAKKWAEQVRGNVSALRGYGDELRHRALPAFTDILHTLAPPIASHEQLLIHITHDMVGYPSLDPLVYGVFARVMSQVEGGELLVVQRGQESALARGMAPGWRDGPWWRIVDAPRDVGAVPGLREGTKLCRASADAYAGEYYAAHGGVDAARQRAIEPVSETNPVRRSDLFLSVQAVLTRNDTGPTALFAGPPARGQAKAAAAEEESDEEDASASESESASEAEDADEAPEEMVCFAVYVLDPVHEIVHHTVSQEMPAKWLRWLDTTAPTPTSSTDEEPHDSLEQIPEDIRAMVESGGVDPREWVAEWVEEALTLAVGVVAQRYVARRMGVGLGGLGKGKRRMDAVIEDGGGEAARAGLI